MKKRRNVFMGSVMPVATDLSDLFNVGTLTPLSSGFDLGTTTLTATPTISHSPAAVTPQLEIPSIFRDIDQVMNDAFSMAPSHNTNSPHNQSVDMSGFFGLDEPTEPVNHGSSTVASGSDQVTKLVIAPVATTSQRVSKPMAGPSHSPSGAILTPTPAPAATTIRKRKNPTTK